MLHYLVTIVRCNFHWVALTAEGDYYSYCFTFLVLCCNEPFKVYVGLSKGNVWFHEAFFFPQISAAEVTVDDKNLLFI